LRRQNGNAADQLNKTLGMQPDYPPAHELLGMVHKQEGRTNEAIAELQRVIDLSGGMYGLGSLGHLYARVGRRSNPQKMLLSVAEDARGVTFPYRLAIVHAGLGEKETAVDDLERAYAERSLPAPFLRFDRLLNNVRAEPRFQAFARRNGLSF
jgi:tetratricopeptide (TPR) repeat protein